MIGVDKRRISSPIRSLPHVFFTSLAFAFLFLTFSSAIAQTGPANTARNGSVTFGFIPGEGAADLRQRGEVLAKLIEKRTGVKVQAYVGTSYGDLIQKTAEKKVDFAFLSALSYVEAESRVNLKVLLKKVWDQGFYYSVLLVKANSGIRSAKDLNGKRIAFVDEKSASGYLYPQVMLKRMGIDPTKDFRQVVYSGSHDHSVHLLKIGSVDAIAVFSNDAKGKDSAWTQHKGPLRDVRVVWSSAAIPNDPLCVRSEFYDQNPKLTHDLMFGLIEMNEDPVVGVEVKRLLGVKSLMTATSSQYEPVREMAREMIHDKHKASVEQEKK